MVDLTAPSGRRQTQRRLTSNRSSILPTRRDTDTTSLTVRSDLRTAARGDGGAADLRSVLSGFMKAGAELYETQTEARKPLYEAQRAEGAADALLGTEDAARMERERAYSTAVYSARARQAVVGVSATIRGEIADLVAAAEAGDDPLNPENDFGPADVEEVINRHYQALLQDEEGNPVSWGDPQAHQLLITGLDRLKNEVWTEAEAIIRNQTDARHMAALGTEVMLDVAEFGKDGRSVVDFEKRVEAARQAGIGASQSVPVFIDQAILAAREHKKPEALEALAQSVRADGTPSLNPAQKLQILNEAKALRTAIEREEEAALEKSSNDTVAAWMLGERPPTRHEIHTAFAEKKVTAQGVRTALAYVEQVEDDRWEDEVRAQTRKSWRRADAAAATRTSQSSGDAETQLMGALYSETHTPQQILSAANTSLAAGTLSAEEYRRVVRDVNQFQNIPALVEQHKAQAHLRALNQVVDLGPTIPRSKVQAANGAFARSLRGGHEPALALANALAALGVGPANTARVVATVTPQR